jgi:hypothetical protein
MRYLFIINQLIPINFIRVAPPIDIIRVEEVDCNDNLGAINISNNFVNIFLECYLCINFSDSL